MSPSPTNFYDLTRPELFALAEVWGFPTVHAAKLWAYVYLAGVENWGAMPELPARFRIKAEASLVFGRHETAAETHSSDGFTRKYLLALTDGRKIETVLMRYTGRVTACISSQAGCRASRRGRTRPGRRGQPLAPRAARATPQHRADGHG